jgi:hypothetical protein
LALEGALADQARAAIAAKEPELRARTVCSAASPAFDVPLVAETIDDSADRRQRNLNKQCDRALAREIARAEQLAEMRALEAALATRCAQCKVSLIQILNRRRTFVTEPGARVVTTVTRHPRRAV